MYDKNLALTKAINGLVTLVEEIFNKDGYLVPVVHVLKENKDKTGLENLILDISEFTKNGQTKEMLNLFLKKLNSEMKPTAIIFISECWVSKIKPEDYDESNTILPREDPNRIEAVTVNINTVIGNSLKLFIIDRTEEKPKLIKYSGFDNNVTAHSKGRFINLVTQENFN